MAFAWSSLLHPTSIGAAQQGMWQQWWQALSCSFSSLLLWPPPNAVTTGASPDKVKPILAPEVEGKSPQSQATAPLLHDQPPTYVQLLNFPPSPCAACADPQPLGAAISGSLHQQQ